MSQIIELSSVGFTEKFSLVVNLIDDYTTDKIIGNVEVSLKGKRIEPVRNPSGYYIFLDIPKGSYTVQIQGGEYYFDEEEDVKLTDQDKNPIINIILKPAPSYPFSTSATLIRGCLQSSKGMGIFEASLKVKERDIETKTTEKGEFVIYFKNLKKDDVTTIDGKKLVKIKEKNPVIEIQFPDHKKKTKSLETEEGKTTSFTLIYS
ncbi:hypothetical protein RE474_13585 [Methanolobus sediminis]|uniref:Carboxypeptidase regulatory-like domain-containing protein n=1 Tax=Methanolobus sediminis TaxID=3072978 RepID=A0AA51UKJ0_9EURY|nr:hypothetical protein [Methanolobus sediminis]WMW25095.1 hypothetical protein RE474_13585 [Methanolobus sediminis]